MRRRALFMSLSSKVKGNALTVISGLDKIPGKTSNMIKVLDALKLRTKKKSPNILLITPKDIESIDRAGRNIPYLTMLPAQRLNTYEVLKNQNIVLMKDAIEKITENFAKKTK